MVVADSREIARRAAALVEVSYRVLRPFTDPEAALADRGGRRLAAAGQRARALRLPPGRRRGGAWCLGAPRPRGLFDPAGRARLPRTGVHPRRGPPRRHRHGVLGGTGRLGRPAPDRGGAGTPRGPGARRAGRQRRRLRRQGGPLEPGADGAGGLAARAPREVHALPGRVAAPPPEAPPVPARVLGRLRRGRAVDRPAGPAHERHRAVRLGREPRARARRRARLWPVRRAGDRRRGRRRADEQPRRGSLSRLRRQPGSVRDGGDHRPPRRAGGVERLGDAGPQRRHARRRRGTGR